MILPHESAVLKYIAQNPECTMWQCARELGLGLADVLGCAADLERRGIIVISHPAKARLAGNSGNGRAEP